MPVTTIALPQDPSSPSGRNTVIYMVRNKNNLEDLRLRRRIEEYNKQLGFRVKTHDFEKLDTYEFLRQLKDCDSDKLSQFRDIQDSIRAMPTPDSMDVVDFSTAIQSLNLAICGQKTELPLLKKNITNNSKSKIAREEGEKLPNIIKRAKTDPLFNYSLLQTKVSRSGSVFKAPTPAWKPSAIPAKEPAAMPDDELLMPHTQSVSNKKLVSATRKSMLEVNTDLDIPPATSSPSDPIDHIKPAITKSVRLVSEKRVTRSRGTQEDGTDRRQNLLRRGLSDKEKNARLLNRRSHGHLDISDPVMKKLICVNQYQSQISEGSELSQLEANATPTTTTPSVSVDDVSGGKYSSKSPDTKQKRLQTPQITVGKSHHELIHSVDDQHSLKSPAMFSHSTSLSKSISIISSSNQGRGGGMVYMMRGDSIVPQKLSLPNLLSLGLGELKDPKQYKYAGIKYAKTKVRSSQQTKENDKGLSDSGSENSQESEGEKEEAEGGGNEQTKRKYHGGRGRRASRKKPPVEIRMQNFFVEVDKLVEKPEKVLVI